MVWGKKAGVSDLVEKLASNSTSKTMLILSNRSFGDTEVESFTKALSENNSLEELLCSGHEISEVGAACFAGALAVNTTLKKLSLGGPNFGDEGACALLKNWSNQTLESLDLEYKSLGERSMDALCDTLLKPNNALKNLNLSRNNINDVGIEKLVKGIETNPNLVTVNLSSNQFGPTACLALGQTFQKAMPRTESEGFDLVLDGNSDIKAEGMAHLVSGCLNSLHEDEGEGNHFWISRLCVSDCEIDSSGSSYLFQAMSSQLSFLNRVKVLNLGNNKIDGVSNLIDVLSKPGCCLEKLSLDSNSLGVHGLHELSKIIRTVGKDGSLKYLDVSANNAALTDDNKNVIDDMMKNFVLAESLDELRLLGNKIGDIGALSLCTALEGDENLRVLSLGAIDVTPEGCEEMIDLLSRNKGLRIVELGSNNIGEKGKAAIDKMSSVRPELDIAVDKSDKN